MVERHLDGGRRRPVAGPVLEPPLDRDVVGRYGGGAYVRVQTDAVVHQPSTEAREVEPERRGRERLGRPADHRSPGGQRPLPLRELELPADPLTACLRLDREPAREERARLGRDRDGEADERPVRGTPRARCHPRPPPSARATAAERRAARTRATRPAARSPATSSRPRASRISRSAMPRTLARPARQRHRSADGSCGGHAMPRRPRARPQDARPAARYRAPSMAHMVRACSHRRSPDSDSATRSACRLTPRPSWLARGGRSRTPCTWSATSRPCMNASASFLEQRRGRRAHHRRAGRGALRARSAPRPARARRRGARPRGARRRGEQVAREQAVALWDWLAHSALARRDLVRDVRRRRDRRPRRLGRQRLHARAPVREPADDAARAGRRRARRQGRGQPPAREEPARRLPPAGRRHLRRRATCGRSSARHVARRARRVHQEGASSPRRSTSRSSTTTRRALLGARRGALERLVRGGVRDQDRADRARPVRGGPPPPAQLRPHDRPSARDRHRLRARCCTARRSRSGWSSRPASPRARGLLARRRCSTGCSRCCVAAACPCRAPTSRCGVAADASSRRWRRCG